jgi:signal transduction histidine kinase
MNARDIGALPSEFTARAANLASISVGAEFVAAAVWLTSANEGAPPRSIALWAVAWSIAVLVGIAAGLSSPRGPDLPAASPGFGPWVRPLTTALRGLAWGLGCALLMPAAIEPQAVALMLLLALQLVAAAAAGGHLPTLLAGCLPATIPPAVTILASGVPGSATLALAALAVTALIVAVGWRVGRRIADGESARLSLFAARRDLELQAAELTTERERAQAASRTAERALAERTRFLAAASHDLRQPVHAIGLFVGALKEEIHEGQARYLIDRLDRSMSGLDDLFNRLLDIARLDTGKITPTFSAFAIAPVLQTLENRFAQLAQQRGLRFRVHARAAHAVRSDPALLIEILMNLLSNAFRYTERGGILLGARRRGDRLLIQVWDTGPGIPGRHLSSIFDEFVQLDRSTGNHRPGLGLGLAIVRRLGDVLECPVSVRSRHGRGSVFQISVPLTAEPASPSSQEAAADTSLAGILVLVVDDEMDILVGMEASLASWGCFVLLARSVEEVREHLTLAERFPDLLITDHRLADGETSEDVVRAMEELVPVQVPILVVSGDTDLGLEERVRGRGWSWMSKPANPQRLRTLVAQALTCAGDGAGPATPV